MRLEHAGNEVGIRTLLLHKLSDISQKIRTVHVAFRIRRDAFRQARAGCVRIRTRVRNEVFDGAVFGASDSNTALRTLVKTVTGLRQSRLSGVGPAVPRFGVGHVHHVVFVDVYPVHVMTRKFLGEMTRKLSVTESQKCAQLRGTCSRRKPSVASANCAQVA